jgi:hypothetical protein
MAAAPDWNPVSLTAPDRRLWAIDAERSFAYIGE